MQFTEDIQLANRFLEKYGPEGGISHMKLQKLVYLAHAWWLTHNDESLLSHKPEVWRYGPVFSSIYNTFKVFGNKPITEPYVMAFQESADTVENETVDSLITWIWKRYGHHSGADLSDMTHKEGTPWQVIVKKNNYKVPYNTEMDDNTIRQHYTDLKNLMMDEA